MSIMRGNSLARWKTFSTLENYLTVKNSFNGRKFPQWEKTYSIGEDDKT